MPSKKTTTKKKRATSRGKVAKTSARKVGTTKKVAKSGVKRPKKKSSARTAAGKTTTARRGAKTTAKTPASKSASRAKTTSPTTKASSTRRKTAAQRGKDRASSARPSRRSVTAAKAANITPDAQGYVFINGRRVRMISTASATTPNKKAPRTTEPTTEPQAQPVAAKPIKTKLTKKDLQHFRELLLQRRAELVGDLSAMESQALKASGGNLSHMPIHMADIGTDTYDQDFMLGLAETERKRLREIDAALQRIDDRTYGICQMTGKPIPKARLNAKPWAMYSIEAAREIEQGLSE